MARDTYKAVGYTPNHSDDGDFDPVNRTVTLKVVEYGDESDEVGDRVEAHTRSGKILTGTIIRKDFNGDVVISRIVDWTSPPAEALEMLKG